MQDPGKTWDFYPNGLRSLLAWSHFALAVAFKHPRTHQGSIVTCRGFSNVNMCLVFSEPKRGGKHVASGCGKGLDETGAVTAPQSKLNAVYQRVCVLLCSGMWNSLWGELYTVLRVFSIQQKATIKKFQLNVAANRSAVTAVPDAASRCFCCLQWLCDNCRR